jgi:hypothetical protein
MSWVGIGGAAVGLIANQMNQPSGGGAGTQTATKAPWAPLQPWILNNATAAQALQNQYLANPMNPQQQQAFANAYGQSDYMRSLIPSLLSQMQGQPSRFDPTNPSQTYRNWNWGLGADQTGRPTLGPGGSMSAANIAGNQPRKQPGGEDLSSFINQTDPLDASNSTPIPGVNVGGMAPAYGGAQSTGGFGTWRYGMAPRAGTQQYADMSRYFALGGSDPNNYYGRGTPALPAYSAPGGI